MHGMTPNQLSHTSQGITKFFEILYGRPFLTSDIYFHTEVQKKLKYIINLGQIQQALPFYTRPFPLLGPLITIILLLLFGPCFFNLLVKFISCRLQ